MTVTEWSDHNPIELAMRIRNAALGLGFVRMGFCPVEPFTAARGRWLGWLAAGYHGEMGYMASEADRADPRVLLPEARSLLVVALPYRGQHSLPVLNAGYRTPNLSGEVARYARGADYHQVFKAKLRALADRCAEITGSGVLARPVVDTAPLLERYAALLAGVGFTGKSTMTIAPGLGSYILLGELLLDVALEPSRPEALQCGQCRLCLEACPTQAFVDEFVLDARRCIAYLTIELKGVIPRELRPLIGTRVFGCDVCQDVCPFNASPKPKPEAKELNPRPDLVAVDLMAWLELTSSGYRKLVHGTALRRVSRVQLARNAAVALGNSRKPEAGEPLERVLRTHSSALVRGHAAWALGNLGKSIGYMANAALGHSAQYDPDPWVREEALLGAAAAS